MINPKYLTNPEQFVSTGNEESCIPPWPVDLDVLGCKCKPENTRRSRYTGFLTSFLIPPPPPPLAARRRQRVPIPAPSAAAPRCASSAAASPPAGDGHDKPRPLFPPKFPFLSLFLRKVSVLPSGVWSAVQIHPAGPGSISPFVGPFPWRKLSKFWGSAKPPIRA